MYERILVPVDGSDGSTAAVERAVDLAQRYGSTVHVLYVLDVRMSPVSADMDRDEILEMVEERGHRPTEAAVERVEAAGLDAVSTVEVGVPHAVIREYVAEEGIDLVVMGTHGRTGISHALLGSVTERVVRTVDVPVLTVPMDGDDSGEE